MNNKIFEWAGVITAILYSLFVALNIGIEFFGFCLLLLSAILIGIWAYRGGHKGILLLQFFIPMFLENDTPLFTSLFIIVILLYFFKRSVPFFNIPELGSTHNTFPV